VARPTPITVVGPMYDLNGDPEQGQVVFSSQTLVRNPTTGDAMGPGAIRSSFDAQGNISVVLPATNDPAWSPVGWTYHLDARLSGGLISYDVVIPYDAPGGEIELAELLPTTAGGELLYAAYSHTHAGDVTDAELTAALAAYLLKTGGTITGNLFVEDAGGTKSYGLRTSGAALDLDAAGVDLYLGVFEGAGNTGTQHKYLRLEAGIALAHAIGRWQFGTNEFGGTVLDVDADAAEVEVVGVLRVSTAGTIKFGVADDANLYRVGPDYIATDGKVATGLDVEVWTAANGLVLHDRVGGAAYRLKVTSGVLDIEPA
jgi:hypothetical protein